jgi:ribonuclease Z
MEKFEVNILGCGSALPTMAHYPSSQVVNLRDKLFMIDCGEGAQLQMRRAHLKFTRLNHIFISHLHGDHCFGLMGLISTFALLGRTNKLHIYADEPLESLLKQQLDFFCNGIGYEVVFHTVHPSEHELIFEDRSVSVYTLPLSHRIPCCGYLFVEKKTPDHIRRDMLDFYHIPLSQINIIKNGAGWTTPEGAVIPHDKLTIPSNPPRSYAYCSDTKYLPDLAKYIDNIDLLYHEATFSNDDSARAKETFHSTASQAATIALACHAKKLCIGHFSARYNDEETLLNEAKAIFNDTIIAKEGLKIEV